MQQSERIRGSLLAVSQQLLAVVSDPKFFVLNVDDEYFLRPRRMKSLAGAFYIGIGTE